MPMFDERDLATIQGLTKVIGDLAGAIKPDTFHNRQVAALRRQSKVLEHIREKRQIYVDSPNPIVTKVVVLNLLDELGTMLIST